MQLEQAFKQVVKQAYQEEAQIKKCDESRHEAVKSWNNANYETRKNILKSHGCLNTVDDYGKPDPQIGLSRIDINFYDQSPCIQSCILHYYGI